MSNDLLIAKRAKKDEFYTQLTDIEKEMVYYKPHFRNKVVLCNCDDPLISAFWTYFSDNFEHLGLKKLITTCYKNTDPDHRTKSLSKRAVYLEYYGDKNGNKVPDPEEIGIHELEGDGSFDSPECLALLEEADIVVTNPPFSLFRDFISVLIEKEKQFLVIGNINALTYKDVFPLIRDNQMWMGHSIKSGDREFGVPDDYPLKTAGSRVDEDGNKYIRVKGVRWYTNLDYPERHEELRLFKKYTPEEYPKYDNLDAINIDVTKHIPENYDGIMGVPITFIDKFSPDQFEILGMGQGNLLLELANGLSEKFIEDYYAAGGKGSLSKNHPVLGCYKNGVATIPYRRIIIKLK